MEEQGIDIAHTKAKGYTISMGSFNLVFAKTQNGMIGCGAFDVQALNKFDYPAAKIVGISNVEELLNGVIKEVNEPARQKGIKTGMTGQKALNLL